jgi:YHS domain-containing protein
MLLRLFEYLFAILFVLSIVRTIVSVVKATLRQMTSGSPKPASGPSSTPKIAAELKRDPVCGTYVSTETALRKTVRGEVVYFCSAACRDKYVA